MKIKSNLFVLLLLTISINTTGTIYTPITVEQILDRTDGVVSGSIIKSKLEKINYVSTGTSYGLDGSETKSTTQYETWFTVYTIQVSEFLYGNLKEKTIKMYTFAYDEFSIDFDVGDKVLVFLRYNQNSRFYMSSEQHVTSFKEVSENDQVTLLSISEMSFSANGKSHDQTSVITKLTKKSLKDLIKDYGKK